MKTSYLFFERAILSFFFFFFDRGCKIDGFPSRGPINFPPNEFDSTSRMSQIYSCKINRPSFVRASIFHACFEIWPGIEAIFFFFRCFSDRRFNREHCTLVEIIFHPMKTWMKYACIYLILFICIGLYSFDLIFYSVFWNLFVCLDKFETSNSKNRIGLNIIVTIMRIIKVIL